MPWDIKDVDKFKKGLSSSEKKAWVKIANGILKACQSGKTKPKDDESCEEMAIRVANSKFGKKESFSLVGDYAFINIFEMADEAVVTESIDVEKRIVPIKIIKTGLSKNNRFYPPEVVEKIASLATHRESRKMYMDHPREFSDFWSRSLNHWTGTVKEAWYKDGEALANTYILNNHNGWIFDEILNSPADVGVSINAIGEVEEDPEGKLTGKKNAYFVREIKYLISADFVTVPAAGGRALRASADIATTEAFDITNQELSYLPYVREQRYYDEVIEPLLQEIEADENSTSNSVFIPNQEELSMSELKTATLEDLEKAGNPIIKVEIQGVVEAEVKKAVGPLNAQLESVKTENSELVSKLAASQEENRALKAENDKFRAGDAEVKARAIVAEVVSSFPEGIITEERKQRWVEMAKSDPASVKADAEGLKEIIEKVKGTSTTTHSASATFSEKEETAKPSKARLSEVEVTRLVNDLVSR